MSSKTGKTFPDRMIFHVDMDAFFASVEQLENPALKGKPVIVGGVDSPRGVVSTASYEARVFGIHSAMPVREARRRCPHGVFISGRHAVYADYSRRIMEVLGEFSPVIEQISVDEAFMDMTGTEGLFGAPEQAALRLKQTLLKRTGLTGSVGVATNKFLAKLASDVKKPDGLFVVLPGEAQVFLDPMPIERLWGVGKKTAIELHRHGLYTIAQVRGRGEADLVSAFGQRLGEHLLALSQGHDDREMETEWREKSISHETTFDEDRSDRESIEAVLLDLAERVARRARRDDMAGRTVSFIWRDPDFSRHSRSLTLDEATVNSQRIYQVARDLYRSLLPASKRAQRPFRLVGVRLSHFGAVGEQLSLFAGEAQPKGSLDRAMDAVRNRFGYQAIARARLIEPDNKPDPT